MRFAYRPYFVEPSPADPAETVYQPGLTVQVEGGRQSFPTLGILDTGSVECILPATIGGYVGAWTCGKGKVVTASGAEIDVDYGRVLLQIVLDKGKTTQVIRWHTVVAFSADRGEDDGALWGNVGFLEHFRVTFDGPARHFTIRLPGRPPDGFEVAAGPRVGPRPRGTPGRTIGPHEQTPNVGRSGLRS